MRPEVRELWLDVSKAGLGNPSSAHASGRRARAWIDRSRARVAAALAVSEDEIHFTSGATEANNVALQGVAAIAGCDAVVVTSSTEHSSVIEPARELERRGHSLRIVGVAESGAPTVDDVVAAARGAALVSIASANNETGAVTDIAAITRALGPERPLLHTDAVQALGRIPVHLNEWGVDLASFSAHKVGGPPGVGVLWRRKGVPLAALCLGGGQEGGIRPGTEDVAGIAAAALAIELAVQEQGSYAERVAELTRELWSGLCTDLPGLRLLGPPIDSPRRLPNTLCLLVPGTDSRSARARPARVDRSSPRTFCSRWVCRTKRRARHCACPSAGPRHARNASARARSSATHSRRRAQHDTGAVGCGERAQVWGQRR
jgi:cysteine desulfurase